MQLFVMVLAVFGLAMLAMGIGVILKRPCLRGSCGGPQVTGPDGESFSCEACPNRARN